MKLFKIAFILLALGLPTFGQQVSVTANAVKVETVSGTCRAGQVRVTTAGVIYTCQSGTWAMAGSSGGALAIGSSVTSGAAGSWLKVDTSGNLTQTRYTTDHCYNCLNGLKLWRAALANAPQTAASVVIVGDSITAGTGATSYAVSWAQQLGKWLQTKYGAGNSESIWRIASNGGATNPDSRWTLTAGTWPSSATGGGITGRNLSSTSASDTLTVSSLYGDTVEVYTVNNTDTSATYCVKINGGSCTNIAQSTTGSLATATVVRNTVSMGTVGNYTVAIQGPASGSVYVAGVSGRISTTGVRVYPFAYSGGQSSDFSSSTDNRDQAFAAYAPNLVIIAVGVNDYYYQVAKATFKTNIERLVTEAQAVSSSVLILFENVRGDVISGPTVLQTEYRDAVIELANTYNVAVLDIYERWGSSYATAVSEGLIADQVHPTQKGHSDYYRATLDAIVGSDAGANPTISQYWNGTMRLTDLGFDNVRLGVYSGTPAITLENGGVDNWTFDIASGLRIVRNFSTTPLLLDSSGNLTITGNVSASGTGSTTFNNGGGSFGIGTASPSGLQVNTTVDTAARAVTNVRMGVAASVPRIFLEHVGSSTQWNMDNASGTFRFVHNNATVPVQMTSTGITLGSSGTELKNLLSGSASLDYAQASANTCEALTLTVTGAADGMPVAIGIPHALANHNTTATFDAWRSASNTVSVRRCVISADGSDPSAATVRVSQFSH